jgi:NADPH-dependent 2,4-dienoyl-CoA reductase/sulfur reductase-like enzyme/rhodanese-related sulfurtransferase
MSNKKKRILIVGGVAGGASAAARARRLSEDAEITLFERGKYISFANCGLPYHISGAIPNRKKLLVQTPDAMRKRFRIDVRTRNEVISVNREKKEVIVRDHEGKKDYSEPYDALILSPGAEPNRPPLPGVDSKHVLTLRSMNDMDAIIKVMKDNKPDRAVVVGGGYIGLEITEALCERGVKVTLVELAPQIMVTADLEMTAPVKQELSLHGVDLRLNTSITAINEDEEGSSVVLSTGDTVRCGLIVLCIGVKPEIKLAYEAGIEIGKRGGIVVDEHMRTSDPDIYAVGDAVEVTDLVGGFQTLIPLAGPANRQGRIAADNIFGHGSTYKKTQGTAICKVFDLTIGMTGMNEKGLIRTGTPYEKIYIHPANHATYYPGASPISIKLLFNPESGVILGSQAVGHSGIDKRIDVLATAIRAGMTVYDLEHLELTYAPPYGSAKDPVNYAGFVAANVLRGEARICQYEDVANPGDDQFLVDVRTTAEIEAGNIPGAHNIPVDELRGRLGELPKNKEILVICQVGLRSYLAYRILTQHGFRCQYFSGGYKTYLAFTDSLL